MKKITVLTFLSLFCVLPLKAEAETFKDAVMEYTTKPDMALGCWQEIEIKVQAGSELPISHFFYCGCGSDKPLTVILADKRPYYTTSFNGSVYMCDILTTPKKQEKNEDGSDNPTPYKRMFFNCKADGNADQNGKSFLIGVSEKVSGGTVTSEDPDFIDNAFNSPYRPNRMIDSTLNSILRQYRTEALNYSCPNLRKLGGRRP